MNEKQTELISEKEKLQNRLIELNTEKKSVTDRIQQIDVELGDENVKSVYGISKDDTDKRCGRSCPDCILPCIVRTHGKCEQCGYGYKPIVDKVRSKYTDNELNLLKLRCPYALLAINN